MTSGKVFLAETRKFYNIFTKQFEYFIWLIVHSYLVPLHHVHSGATKVIIGETLGLFPIMKQRLREDMLVLSKQPKKGRGTTEEQSWHKKKWV